MKKILFFISKVFITISLLYFTIGFELAFALNSISKVLKAIQQIAILLVSLIIIINIWFTKNKHKKKSLITVIILILIMIGISVYQKISDNYEESITLNSAITSINTNEYMPFSANSKIVTLKEEESTFKLYDNLPIVDGAAALFPVYSAFVNAVYPKEEVNHTMEATTIYTTAADGNTEKHESFDLETGIFQYNNTVNGYKKLAEKQTDIFFGAYPSEEQIAYAKKNNTTLKYTPIGREGFVFFVNKENPIDNLSSEDIRKIYSGEITNWKELGGNNKEILAFQRNEGSGSQSMLIRFMEGKKLKEPIKNEFQDSMGLIIDSVSDYKNYNNSIGFSFRYYAEDIIGNQNVKLLSIDGIAPTVENITNGVYPITTDFYAVTYEENKNENVEEFINWILSEQGKYIITETGYAPIN